MAALTWYMTNSLVSVHQEMSETSPGADATSSPNVGWIVGTTAPTVYAEFDAGVKAAAATFSATARPDGSINTTIGDCLRTTNVYNGSFASANWTINGVVIGVTNSGAQDGRLRYRIFKSANADGSGATEVTAGAQIGATITNLSTTQQNSSVTFNPGAFSLSNEYLFVQVGWEITGAGGMSTTDVVFRVGNTATRIVSSDFTASSQQFTANVSETVSLSESTTATFAAAAAVSESVGAVGESTAAAYGAIASPAETVAHAESLASLWATSPGVAETVGLNESLASGLLLSADVNESVGAIGEAASAGYEARPVPQETVEISESAGTTFAAITSPSESVSLSEAAAAGVGASATIAESLGSISESSSVGYSATAAAGETMSIAESVEGTQSGGGGASYTADVGESVALADALGSTLTTTALLADTVALAEQVSAGGLVPIYDLATSTVVASPDGQSSIVSTGGRASITSIDATAIIEEN
jgi:hypothetical protein